MFPCLLALSVQAMGPFLPNYAPLTVSQLASVSASVAASDSAKARAASGIAAVPGPQSPPLVPALVPVSDAMASVPVTPPPPPPNAPVVATMNPLAELPGATPAPDFVPVPAATAALPLEAAFYPNPLALVATGPQAQPQAQPPARPAALPRPLVAAQPAAAPRAVPGQEAISLRRDGPGVDLDTTFFPGDQDLYVTAAIPQSPAPPAAAAPLAPGPAPVETAPPTPAPAPQAGQASQPEATSAPAAAPEDAASESADVLSLYTTAQQLAYGHRFDLAIITLDRALTLEPTNPSLLALLGSLYYSQGAVDLARQSWAQALVYDPSMADVRIALDHVSPGGYR